MKRTIVLLAMFAGSLLHAQQAVVTATIPGYAGGSVTATFQSQGSTGAPNIPTVVGPISSTGSFSLTAWLNTYGLYTPSVTTFNICAGTPAVCYNTSVSISSNPQDISASFANAPQPPGVGGVSQLVAGTNITLSPTNGQGIVTVTASNTAATAFSAITSATNTNHLTMGTGGILDAVGGAINATSAPYSGLTGSVPTWNQNTTGNAATASSAPYSGLTGSVPTWNQDTTGNAATATVAGSVPYTGLTGSVPTWNQNTTGNAATATLATSALAAPWSGLTGSVPTFNQNTTGTAATATSALGLNGVALSGLSTGLLKITTGTGVPSTATAGTDYLTPTGSSAGLSVGSASAFGVVRVDGTTITAAGGVLSASNAGTVTSVTGTANQIDVAGTSAAVISFDAKALNSLYGGGVFFVQDYFGSGSTVDTWVNACVAAALAVSGLCDTTALSGQTLSWAFNTHLSLGNSSGVNVALRLPCFGQWNMTLSGGTIDMIDQYPGTALYSDCGAAPGATFNFKNQSGAGGANYGYQTIPPTTSGGNVWYYTHGFGILQVASGTGFASGIEWNINAGEDDSEQTQLYGLDGSSTDTTIFQLTAQNTGTKACCNAKYGLYGEAAQTGPTGITILGTSSAVFPVAITLFGGNAQHPRSGLSDIVCTDSTHGLTVHFTQTLYIEVSNVDTATPPVIQVNGCGMFNIDNLVVKAEIGATTRQVINISNAFNSNVHIGSMKLLNGGGSWVLPNTQAIVNANGSTVATNAAGDIVGYDSLTHYFEAVSAVNVTATNILGPLGTNAAKGVVQGDGSSINCVLGVCSTASSVGGLIGTTGSIGGSSISGTCATGTASITGATTGMQASASAVTSAAPGAFSVYAQVLSTNTATVYVCGTGTPTASTYLVAVGSGATPASTSYYTSPFAGTATSGLAGVANHIAAWAFIPAVNITFNNIYLTSHTADASNLYSAAITNATGGLLCHPTTGIAVPTANTLMVNACSEGTVTLTAGTIYILLTTGNSTTGVVAGTSADAVSGPFFNTNLGGCTSASGVISGTCTISLTPTVYTSGIPAFLLH